jgi:hypothetical protein
MDLERGKVVEEYRAHGNDCPIRVNAIAGAAKGEDTNVFLACNNRGMYTFDPRVSGGKAVQTKTYSTNQKLSCLGATTQGNVAVGCETGEIKLFKQIG